MFLSRFVKGVLFSNARNTKGVPFLPKMVYKRGRGSDLGAEPPCINFL